MYIVLSNNSKYYQKLLRDNFAIDSDLQKLSLEKNMVEKGMYIIKYARIKFWVNFLRLIPESFLVIFAWIYMTGIDISKSNIYAFDRSKFFE